MPLQVLLNGIVAGSIYLLVAVGFAWVYFTTRFLNFAHGVVFAAGAYFAYLLHVQLSLPFSISVVGAVALCVATGCIIELMGYRPLRRRGSSPLILLLASLGVYIVLQNVISLAFGDDMKVLEAVGVSKVIDIVGARLTTIQAAMGIVAGLMTAVIALVLRATRLGKAMRAVASDPELACVSGVDADQIRLWSMAGGSGLAGMAGILVCLDTGMTPMMGMNAMLVAVVALVLGGLSGTVGVAIGAVLLGVAQHVSAWVIGPEWQDTAAFLIVLVVLLLKPREFISRAALAPSGRGR